MTLFSVGDPVTIRFGGRQGQKGKIVKSQPEHAYTVKVEDGSVLVFSEKGLARAEGQSERSLDESSRTTSGDLVHPRKRPVP